jgi:hypothetical protein
MPNKKTDSLGFSTENPDVQRDLSSKGDPVQGLGNPTDRRGVSHPYDDDIQTQLAAKSKPPAKARKK